MNVMNMNKASVPEGLVLLAPREEDFDKAKAIADHLDIPLLTEIPEEGMTDLHLVYDEKGLSLADENLSMQGDFTKMEKRLKRNNLQQEFLVKASKLKGVTGPMTAVDATAGLGEDSLLLAAAGYEVRLFEYDPVIAALLRDALERAREIPSLSEIAGRMILCEGDSIAALTNMDPSPDLILLDPMFPARQKSGLIKKKFQLLQQLERPCSDEEDLLRAAISAKPRRILIKRPLKGPFLAGMKPDYSLNGKAIRYDVMQFVREI